MDKRLISAGGVVAVFVVLVGGCCADAMNTLASEDTKNGCHTDYYLRAAAVGVYCAKLEAP